MAFSRCKFCGDSGVFPFPVVSKKGVTEYFRCKECMAISLSDKEHLPLSQQLARYRQHNNNLNDFGYAHFLTSFVYHTFSFLAPFAPSSILDYGCGPNPALIDLLHLVLKRQQDHGSFTKSTDFNGIDSVEKCIDFLAFFLSYLPKQELIYGWDPFFSPNGKKEPANLVLCLEVAEHFENPWEGFSGLAQSCTVDGYVAIGTLPIPDSIVSNMDFKGWWYKDDKTHVSFYTEKAMVECGKTCGLRYMGKASPRIFIFKKLGDA